jgi:hypothetical protein
LEARAPIRIGHDETTLLCGSPDARAERLCCQPREGRALASYPNHVDLHGPDSGTENENPARKQTRAGLREPSLRASSKGLKPPPRQHAGKRNPARAISNGRGPAKPRRRHTSRKELRGAWPVHKEVKVESRTGPSEMTLPSRRMAVGSPRDSGTATSDGMHSSA